MKGGKLYKKTDNYKKIIKITWKIVVDRMKKE